MSRTIAKNTTFLTVAYVIQKIISFFYFIFITRMIGVDDVGKYTFALGFTTLSAVFIDWGLSQILIRECAKYKEKTQKYLAATLAFRLASSVFVYLAVIVAINVFVRLAGYDPITIQLVYLSGIVMILDSFTLGFWGVFRGHQNLKYESIGVVGNQIIVIAVGTASLLLGWPLHFLIVAFIAGSLFNLIFSAALAKNKLKLALNFSWDKQLIKFLLKLAFPFALLAIFGRMYGYIDQILLYFLSGEKSLAFYSAGYKMIFALQFIPSAFAAAIFPAMSHYFVRSRDQLKVIFDKSMAYLTILAVPMMFGLASLAREIIITAYKSEYEPSILGLQILSVGLIFVFLNFPLGSLLNATDRQILNTKLVGVTMLINLILNAILIPWLSFIGAGIAFLFSHGFLFSAGLLAARKIIPYSKKLLVFIFAKSILSAGVMSMVLLALKDRINLLIAIGLGAAVYFIMMFLVKGLDKSDLIELKKIFIKKADRI
ncbi:MAG: flippase [Patescibacteria group bacterium]